MLSDKIEEGVVKGRKTGGVNRDRREAAGLTMSPEFEEIWRRNSGAPARNRSVLSAQYRGERRGN
jgi:hypothetical protein